MKTQKKGIRLSMRHRMVQKPRLTTKQVALMASAGLIIPALLLTLLNISQPKEAIGAVAGDYRSITSGNWTSLTSWETFDGTTWNAATVIPTDAAEEIVIQNGHTITVDADVTADQVIVNTGGLMNINSGITFTLANGAGNDLSVSGTVKNAGSITPASGSTIDFAAAGKYQHAYTLTPGAIPTATWNSTSTCEIMGYTDNNIAPSGLTQTFGNFTWNCQNQNKDINLLGGLKTIAGSFNMISTKGKELRLTSTALTLNITGDYNHTGGEISFADANVVVTVNLSGDWTHTGGKVKANSGSTSTLVFKKAGIQKFTQTVTDVNNVSFTVNSGSTLLMGNNIMEGKNFTLNSGGTLSISDYKGIATSGNDGNIQVSGTRTFNSGANYIYNGSVAQLTGNALPATVNNLKVDNAAGITLTNAVAVNGILTLTNGKVTCSSIKYITVNNKATNAVTGHSASGYIVGPLNRKVNASGDYEFPVGNSATYQFAKVTLTGTSGIGGLTASFTAANPVTTASPLGNLSLEQRTVKKMLNYGYWSINPDLPMLTGTYAVQLKAAGNTISPGGRIYCVLKRANSLTPWQSIGTHNYSTQSVSNNIVTAMRSGLTSFSDFAIGYGEFIAIKNPLLFSGVDGAVGAVYRFPEVTDNIDAHVEILEMNNATLSAIDYFDNVMGYEDAWQPFIDVAANKTSSILWKVTFKRKGSMIDTLLDAVSMTAIDVDGAGPSNVLREYIEATNIYDYSLDPASTVTVTPNGAAYRATSAFANVPNIDTARHDAMAQMNFRNVSSFTYRTGVISTYGSGMTRQFSLYFSNFISGSTPLPVNLLYFNAMKANGRVDLKWATGSEKDNDFFTVERSRDGKSFEPLFTVDGFGTTAITHTYTASDNNPIKGSAYYRLKQTDYNGEFTYSDIRMVKYDETKAEAAVSITSVNPTAFNDRITVNYKAMKEGQAEFMITSVSGQVVASRKVEMEAGNNYIQWEDEQNLPKGVYFVVIVAGMEKSVMKIVKQ